MNAEAFAQSLASGPHALLSSLIGDWRGTTRTWFTPGELSDTSGTTGGVRAILGGAFVVHEYAGSLGGDKLSGLATLGFDLGEQRFVCAWVDSFHNGTGVMLSRGDPGVTDAISVLGSYDVSGGSP